MMRSRTLRLFLPDNGRCFLGEERGCVRVDTRRLKWALFLIGLLTLLGLVGHIGPERILEAGAALGPIAMLMILLPSILMYFLDTLGWRFTLSRAYPFPAILAALCHPNGRQDGEYDDPHRIGGRGTLESLLAEAKRRTDGGRTRLCCRCKDHDDPRTHLLYSPWYEPCGVDASPVRPGDAAYASDWSQCRPRPVRNNGLGHHSPSWCVYESAGPPTKVADSVQVCRSPERKACGFRSVGPRLLHSEPACVLPVHRRFFPRLVD